MFKDVLPGEPRHLESAARYNAVNRLLKSRELGVDAVPVVSPDAAVIAGLNGTGETIYCGSPVKIAASEALEDWESEIWSIAGYRIEAALDDSGWWGIAAENIPPGNYGNVIVHGMAVAKISSGGGNGGYLLPAGGDFVRSAQVGRGMILKISGTENGSRSGS